MVTYFFEERSRFRRSEEGLARGAGREFPWSCWPADQIEKPLLLLSQGKPLSRL